MNLQIAVLLGQDGITNGAVYALLALSIVLVFTVTRVLLIPLGEFVAYGALTLAALQAGQRSGVVWLLMGLCAACALLDLEPDTVHGFFNAAYVSGYAVVADTVRASSAPAPARQGDDGGSRLARMWRSMRNRIRA